MGYSSKEIHNVILKKGRIFQSYHHLLHKIICKIASIKIIYPMMQRIKQINGMECFGYTDNMIESLKMWDCYVL